MTARPASENPVPVFGATITLLAMLLAVDFIFILTHALHVWSPWMYGDQYSIESENGLAALYQYIKQIWLVGCLALAFLQTRGRAFIAWSALFAYLLLDDLLQIHERGGELLAARLGFPAIFGLRPEDLGEIAMAAVIGCFAMALLVIAYRRGSGGARQLSADLMCLLVALALFGVFFDTLHTITYFKAPALAQVFGLIEDGGEMLVVSAMVVYAFDITSNRGRMRVGVWAWIRGLTTTHGFRAVSRPYRTSAQVYRRAANIRASATSR